jgi:two-component system response regulator PilR (NtrC family)
VLGPDTLPLALRGEREPEQQAGGAVELPTGFSLERHLDDAERKYLLAALQRAGGVKTRAAELLGLSFRSFRYRAAKHGLGDREDGGEPGPA